MRIVILKSQSKFEPNEMDAVEYCKRYGEHLLAVKVVGYRKGTVALGDFLESLTDLVLENNDILKEE